MEPSGGNQIRILRSNHGRDHPGGRGCREGGVEGGFPADKRRVVVLGEGGGEPVIGWVDVVAMTAEMGGRRIGGGERWGVGFGVGRVGGGGGPNDVALVELERIVVAVMGVGLGLV